MIIQTLPKPLTPKSTATSLLRRHNHTFRTKTCCKSRKHSPNRLIQDKSRDLHRQNHCSSEKYPRNLILLSTFQAVSPRKHLESTVPARLRSSENRNANPFMRLEDLFAIEQAHTM